MHIPNTGTTHEVMSFEFLRVFVGFFFFFFFFFFLSLCEKQIVITKTCRCKIKDKKIFFRCKI